MTKLPKIVVIGTCSGLLAVGLSFSASSPAIASNPLAVNVCAGVGSLRSGQWNLECR